jgi:hypothetical protein
VDLQDELLARMHEDLGVLVAKAREPTGTHRFAEASQLLGDGYRQLFSLDRRFLQMMQPEQVPAVLGRTERVSAFFRMIAEEADPLRLQHDTRSAAATARWTVRILEAGKVTDDETLLARLRVMSDLAEQ